MKNFLYLYILLTILSITSIFCQKIDYSSLLIPSELKENANAVVRSNSIEILINDIDDMEVYKRKVVTVLNKSGEQDAAIFEGYDDDTKIKKLSAVIYDASGKQIKKFSKGKFLDVSAVDGGTLYSDSRVKYVDYTPISYPYTLVFESEYKTSTTGFIPSWFPVNGYYVSTEKSSYTLLNPKDIPLRKKHFNFKGFNIENKSTQTELHYVLSNQKAVKFERNTVSYREILPKVLPALTKFSLKGVDGEYTNWNEFGKWMYNNLLKGRTEIEDEATKNKIKDLVKGVKDPLEKAKIVYQYVQDKTRYISVQVGIGGWEPIEAKEVDKVGYGDCKGLVNYTKALLDIAGVESYYTIVYADDKRNIDKEFSSIQGNHIILNIPNKGDDVWLECTSQIIPFGFLGDFTDDRDVVVITPEGGIVKRTTSYKSATNLQEIKGSIQLDEKGNVVANLLRVSKGLQYDDKYYYETFSKEELIKNYKRKVWSYNNNLDIEYVSIKNDKEKIEFSEDLKISIRNFASINDNQYLFRVNIFNKENYVPKRYRNRKYPLKIRVGYKDVDEYDVKLPKGYVIDVLPSEKNISTKFGNYKVTFTKINDTTFKYKKTILIKDGIYPKEDYKAYRSFRKSIAKYDNLRIAITKKN